MLYNLESVTRMIEHLSINPVYDTNWCDMPAEIKSKCIGKLEFMERLSLRRTAKAERSLVDSQKIEFCKAHFRGSDSYVNVSLHCENGYYFIKEMKNDKTEALEFMKYVWKIGVFEKIKLSLNDNFIRHEEFMNYDGLFTVKKLKVTNCKFDALFPILKKLKTGVESIMINPDMDLSIDHSIDEVLAISHIQNASYWHIKYCEHTDCLYKVAQMWIDTKAKIGSTFQAAVFRDDCFEEYLEEFTDRIVSKNEKRVRIRTNNPDCQILLERGLDEVVKITDSFQYFRLMVISAEMKETEYDDNCEKWICNMDPEMENKYDSEYDPEDSRNWYYSGSD